MKKKVMVSMVALGLGLIVGGAGAFGTGMVVEQSMKAQPMVFVPTGEILAPLVSADGRLASYVTFTAQIEVPLSREDEVKRNIPVLLNAINMRTYRTPMASGRDGLVPRVDLFEKLVATAAGETFGDGVVARVAITQAQPS